MLAEHPLRAREHHPALEDTQVAPRRMGPWGPCTMEGGSGQLVRRRHLAGVQSPERCQGLQPRLAELLPSPGSPALADEVGPHPCRSSRSPPVRTQLHPHGGTPAWALSGSFHHPESPGPEDLDQSQPTFLTYLHVNRLVDVPKSKRRLGGATSLRAGHGATRRICTAGPGLELIRLGVGHES